MTVKVLCVHGIGRHDPMVTSWQDDWTSAISQAVHTASGDDAKCSFCLSDGLFSQRPLTVWQTLDAIATLGGNAIFGSTQRGLFDGDNIIGWTAGMVLQWAGNSELRKAARALLVKAIQDNKPDVIVAHSLGSLIAYDLLSSDDGPAIADGQTLLTIGSQINSRFVGGIFEHGVMPLTADARWLHVFNPNDHVFTAQIHFEGARNFRQVVTTPFGSGLTGGHTDLTTYLNNSQVLSQIWKPILTLPAPQLAGTGVTATREISLSAGFKRQPNRRALLIGINEYNNPANRLEGCVNDVYEVSALLQECGFTPDDIRVVFDGRATAEGIRERLGWLYADTRDGDVRFLFYSGHGLQMPVFGKDGKPGRMVEALVAADFDGTLTNCITDRDLSALYSTLPRDCQAIIALDCCYAGGLTRDGGPRVRGIDPPDDVRHQMLRWDSAEEMWIPRDFKPLIPLQAEDNKTQADDKQKPKWAVGLSGQSGCVARIGSSIDHRRTSNAKYDKLKRTTGWEGPFQPLVITACNENQKSSEYLHGASSYGAFTFAFCRTIRTARHKGTPMSVAEAVAAAGKTLESLGYQQNPGLAGPSLLQKRPIPFLANAKGEIAKPKPGGKASSKKDASAKKASRTRKKK